MEGEVAYHEEPLSPPGPGEVLICVGDPQGRVVLDLQRDQGPNRNVRFCLFAGAVIAFLAR